ncbi:MAG: sensor histidine kinase [Spirochaetaceae bacterium]|nr:MAG: sensor histidine kinase [Spirochaetaceae bacterium]
MRSMFRRTILAFTVSLVLLLVVLSAALIGGYYHSVTRWSERRIMMVEAAASDILRGASRSGDSLPQDVPVFVYDRSGTLVASNRGGGWRRDTEHWERLAIDDDGVAVGHVEIGQAAFRNDAANRALMQTLVRTSAAGALVALAAAMVVAWLFARSLSRPAARVAEGIDAIADGTARVPIPEHGAEEISRIARAANTLAARLQSERALRAQWAQDVTHDLRTPIASIRAQLEAVVDGVYVADSQRISGTLGELGRVEALIADLDELMRLESPEVVLKPASVATADLVATLRQRFDHEIDRKRISFLADLATPTIWADEALLDRAVSNLLANALRHAPEGGTVAITVQSVQEPAESGDPCPPGRSVVLSVCNDGPPIPPDELPHLFDRLFRGEYARTSAGSGLGLTIARRIVTLHGGTIGISSSRADGTIVRVVLPGRPGSV